MVKITLNNWTHRKIYFTELDQYKSFQAGYRSYTEYSLPKDGVEVSTNTFMQLKDGKHRGCIGRIIRILPRGDYSVFCRLSFADNAECDCVFGSLRETSIPATDLIEYKKPTFVTNVFRQEIEAGDKVILSRNNQVFFGVVKEIRSNTCLTISLYPIRQDARKDIRINNLDGIIRWDEDLDFETFVSLLVLQA